MPKKKKPNTLPTITDIVSVVLQEIDASPLDTSTKEDIHSRIRSLPEDSELSTGLKAINYCIRTDLEQKKVESLDAYILLLSDVDTAEWIHHYNTQVMPNYNTTV